MNCRACEFELPADAVFCPECGVKVGVVTREAGRIPAERGDETQDVSEVLDPRAAVVRTSAGPGLKAGGPTGAAESSTSAQSQPEGRPTTHAPRPAGSTPDGVNPAAGVHVSRLTSAREGGARASLDALLARANLLRMRGQWAEAIERCTEALRLDPHSGAAHSLLGDIYENQGRLDKATHWYQLALEQNPDSIADKAKLARVRELQAVRKRTGDPRFSWAYLVAVAGVAFLFVAFVMAAIVAGDRGRAVNAPANVEPMPEFPPSARPRVQPLDHTDAEEKLASYLIAELHSQFMTVVTVTLHPREREALVTTRIGDRPITPDPMGGGRRDHILREGYRVAFLARQHLHEQKQDLQFVTVRALQRLNTGSGTGGEEVWRGHIDVRRIVAPDDKASVNEVRSVYDLRRMYWNPVVGF